jgi:predicted PurR-regulated permease PerM
LPWDDPDATKFGHRDWALSMVVSGIFIDSCAKPRLIGFGMAIPMSLIFGVFRGLLAFGFLGLFIGPALIAIMFTLLQAWRAAIAGHPAAANVPSLER